MLIGLLLSAVFLGQTWAKGLEASPAVFHWRVKTLGKLVKLPLPIKVTNHSRLRRTYQVSFRSAHEIGAKDEPGYKPIRRKEWLSASVSEFILNPGQSGGPAIFALIPDQPENYGGKWLVYLQIKERPPGGDQFALACYTKIYLDVLWKKTKNTR
ncbi:MAG: hypothetical protein KKC80_05070 [Candidatus Margulisbacteria bacterium]|nr:hypothetical protein [Candidatus Margulisiibacteriota bacterium]MBU1616887.1 hypothetical protein [Candidatus Margulisiibacteriota bacterium]